MAGTTGILKGLTEKKYQKTFSELTLSLIRVPLLNPNDKDFIYVFLNFIGEICSPMQFKETQS